METPEIYIVITDELYSKREFSRNLNGQINENVLRH